MADKEYNATEGNAEKFGGEGSFVTRGASVDRGEAERVAANEEDLHRGIYPCLHVSSELARPKSAVVSPNGRRKSPRAQSAVTREDDD
jgi:hypothetical protein